MKPIFMSPQKKNIKKIMRSSQLIPSLDWDDLTHNVSKEIKKNPEVGPSIPVPRIK
jgi:hypothetical protein